MINGKPPNLEIYFVFYFKAKGRILINLNRVSCMGSMQ